MADERYALGVDVGGTFTDLALVRLSDKRIFYHKIPSTPEDPSLAVTQGVEELIAGEDIDAGAITYFGHGTTVATNACIQGRTALTGLLTTAGFRDVLEIRRQRQPHNYDIRMPKPVPPVPRHLRDAHYKGAADLGHGVGYRYPHDDPSGWVHQQHRPDEVVGNVYYEPSIHGAERDLADHWPGPSQPTASGSADRSGDRDA